MLNWHVFGKISTKFHRFTWISQLCDHVKFLKHCVAVVFHFPGVASWKPIALSSIKSSLQIQESVCPHVFYCKVQTDNPRWKTSVRPKTGCFRAKIGLTGPSWEIISSPAWSEASQVSSWGRGKRGGVLRHVCDAAKWDNSGIMLWLVNCLNMNRCTVLLSDFSSVGCQRW